MRAALEPRTKLAISVPPGFGKSWLASMWNPVWFLNEFPHRDLILCGHGKRFAAKWGRRVRNLIRLHHEHLRVRLADDATAADDWSTSEGGGMLCAGVGGDIMGERGDLIVVDDYCKNWEQAFSPTFREKVWEWWDSTASTRLRATGSAVVVATRWHPDDLIGRLLSREEGWEHIVLPALAKRDDPLGRAEGEPLWPEMWPLAVMLERKRKGTWVWGTIYQQDPTPPEGNVFERSAFRYWRWASPGVLAFRKAGKVRMHRLADLVTFCTVDLATSERASADWTVIATWAVDRDGNLFLLDLVREQMAATKHEGAIRSAMDQHACACAFVESDGYQLSTVQRARAAGLRVRKFVASKHGGKLARAVAAACEVGEESVFLPASAPWLSGLEEELLAFPKGEDHQVDALSCAVLVRDRVSGGGEEQRWKVGGGAGAARAR